MRDEKPITRTEFEALRAELAELKLGRLARARRSWQRNRRVFSILIACLAAVPLAIYAINITKPHTFVAGNAIIASEVNSNFDTLYTKVNALDSYHPPVGTILAWHKSLSGTPALPVSGEWVECNGQTLSDVQSSYNGQTIPNLNGDPAGANSPGQSAKVQMFLRGGVTSGTGQQDAFQGHWHQGGTLRSDLVTGTHGPGAGTVFWGQPVGDPISDGTNGTPRTANETRPVNMSVVWIMKVK